MEWKETMVSFHKELQAEAMGRPLVEIVGQVIPDAKLQRELLELQSRQRDVW